MKKVFCILLVSLCVFAAFSQEADAVTAADIPEDVSVTITRPNWGEFSLGVSNSFFSDKNYKSVIFEDRTTYLNPFFEVGGQWCVADRFSLNFLTTFNLTALNRGVKRYAKWFKGCNTWAGDATLLANALLGFTPYLIGVFPAFYDMMCAFDMSVGVYYHPYYNDWCDTKIGMGLSNEPSNFYDLYGWSLFLQPFVFIRAEANVFKGRFMATAFCSYANDLFYLADVWLDDSGNTTQISLNKFTVGAKVSFIDTRTTEDKRAERKAKRAAKKQKKSK